MTAIPGTVAFDEFGRPFIILRNQEKQQRLTGHDAIKVKDQDEEKFRSRIVYAFVRFFSWMMGYVKSLIVTYLGDLQLLKNRPREIINGGI